MQYEVGAILDGKVTGITGFGAFVSLPGGKTGMVHISEVASVYVKEIRDFIKEGDDVKVKILNIGEDGRISLSIKRAVENNGSGGNPRRGKPAPKQSNGPNGYEWTAKKQENMSFEDMMSKFKQSSEEKMSDLKKSQGPRVVSRRGY